MTRTPNPRYTTDIRLAVELGASDQAEAEARLTDICDFIADRLGRSTFTRLAGQPQVVLMYKPSEVVPS